MRTWAREEMEMAKHREWISRSMRLPRLGRDTMQKLVTRICVEASEEELRRMIPCRSSTPLRKLWHGQDQRRRRVF